jgi:glutathione S-transferase
MRCLWMLEEIGEPYQLIEKSTRPDDLQTAEYLRLNPNARIPTLVDGEVVLWESMAINIYLAQKYQGPMRCDSPELLGLAAQWSFWAVLELEELLLDLLQHRAVLPDFARDPSGGTQRVAIAKATRGAQRRFGRAAVLGRRPLYRRRPECGQHPGVGQNGPAGFLRPFQCGAMAGRLLDAARLSSRPRSDSQEVIRQ